MQDLLIRLHQFLKEHYDLEEFRTLCFDLSVGYDDLRGEGLSAKARELTLQLKRQRRIDALLLTLQKQKPDPFKAAGLDVDPATIESVYSVPPASETKAASNDPISDIQKLGEGAKRREAIISLDQSGYKWSLADLRKLLSREGAHEVVLEVVKILGRLEGPEVEKTLLDILDKDEDSRVSLEIVNVLDQSGYEWPPDLQVDLSNNRDPAVRLKTVNILERSKDSRAVDALQVMRTDPNRDVRSEAREALKQLGVNYNPIKQFLEFLGEHIRWLWLSYLMWLIVWALGFIADLGQVLGLTLCQQCQWLAALALIGGIIILGFSFLPDFKRRYKNWDRGITFVLTVLAVAALGWYAAEKCDNRYPEPIPHNRCPEGELSMSPALISPGETAVLTARVTDPENDPVVYYWETTLPGLEKEGGPYKSPQNVYTAPSDSWGIQVEITVIVDDLNCGEQIKLKKRTTFPMLPSTPTNTSTPTPTLTSTPTNTPTPTSTPTPSPTPTPPSLVALITSHSKYVTAMDDQPGWNWELMGNAREIKDWEKFALLCLDNGQVAFRTHHNKYVTATDDQSGWDWVLRADTTSLSDWERFKLINADTGQDLSCQKAFRSLAQGVITISLKTHHGRYVAAMDGQPDWNWVLRAGTETIGDSEKFTVVPLFSQGYVWCRTGDGTGQIENDCLGEPYFTENEIDWVCQQEISIQPSQFTDRVLVIMTSRELDFGYSLWEIEFYGPDNSKISLTEKATAEASSVQGDSWMEENAIDNNMTTRWDSEHKVDPQWFEVTLFSPAEIGRIALKWERAFALDYCVVVTSLD